MRAPRHQNAHAFWYGADASSKPHSSLYPPLFAGSPSHPRKCLRPQLFHTRYTPFHTNLYAFVSSSLSRLALDFFPSSRLSLSPQSIASSTIIFVAPIPLYHPCITYVFPQDSNILPRNIFFVQRQIKISKRDNQQWQPNKGERRMKSFRSVIAGQLGLGRTSVPTRPNP